MCGALLAGCFADRVGRRNLIAGCAAVYAVAAVAVIKPVSWQWILVLTIRFICGLAIGEFTVGCPLYLSELAPISHRGRFVGLFQVQVGAGVVVAFFFGSLSAIGSAAVHAWKCCLGIGSIPPALLLCLMISVPNTEPAFFTTLGRKTKTMSGRFIPGGYSGREKLFRRKNTPPLVLATSIAISNQLSGVNVLLLYLLDILASAGIGLSLGHTYTVVISCIGLATTVIAMAAAIIGVGSRCCLSV